jgi:hypothetical protein
MATLVELFSKALPFPCKSRSINTILPKSWNGKKSNKNKKKNLSTESLDETSKKKKSQDSIAEDDSDEIESIDFKSFLKSGKDSIVFSNIGEATVL